MNMQTNNSAPPVQVYHQAWSAAAKNIFDPSALRRWKQWEHRFDHLIHTTEDAVRYANEMLDSLNDMFTYVLDPEQVNEQRQQDLGYIVGISVVFDAKLDAAGEVIKTADGSVLPVSDRDGYPLVHRVHRDGPAFRAGLKAGDAVVSIDETSTAGISYRGLTKLIRGNKGSIATLEIVRDGERQTLSIAREPVALPQASCKMLDDGIGYIRVPTFFTRSCVREVINCLSQLKEARALIFDLRDNPGGDTFSAVEMASLLLEQGPVVTIKTRIPGNRWLPRYMVRRIRLTLDRQITESITDTIIPGRKVNENDVAWRVPYMADHRPVVILIDGDTASASEMFTGTVQDNMAAIVVGTRSLGKGIGQIDIDLPNGCRMHVTSGRYHTPSGRWFGDGGNNYTNGITPDVLVAPGGILVEFGSDNDEQLKGARQLLVSKLRAV